MKKSTSTLQVAFENYGREKKLARSSERVFGTFFGTLFLSVGILKIYLTQMQSNPWNFLWFIFAAFMYLAACIYPKILMPFNTLWIYVGKILHTIVNPMIMGVLFFGILSPLSYVTKLLGRDPLRLKYDATAKSYWIVREPSDQTDLKNQF